MKLSSRHVRLLSAYFARCGPRGPYGKKRLIQFKHCQMEPLGARLRRQRRKLGLTLDDLAGRTGISKPYLSLIETGRVPNPPSDEKLRRLEQSLGFTPGELVTQAHLQRTPRDVRAVLSKLLSQRKGENGGLKMEDGNSSSSSTATATINLDDAYLNGVLHDLVEKSA